MTRAYKCDECGEFFISKLLIISRGEYNLTSKYLEVTGILCSKDDISAQWKTLEDICLSCIRKLLNTYLDE